MNLSQQYQTKALIQKYYDAFNSGNWAGMLQLLHPEFSHDANQGGRKTGKAKFQEFLRHMDDCYSEQLKDMVIMVSDDGARASAEFVVHGSYKKTDAGLPPAKGQKYQLPAGAFFEIKNNLIARVSTHYNLPAWIQMVSV